MNTLIHPGTVGSNERPFLASLQSKAGTGTNFLFVQAASVVRQNPRRIVAGSSSFSGRTHRDDVISTH